VAAEARRVLYTMDVESDLVPIADAIAARVVGVLREMKEADR
jgi:hypothetical protein